VRPRASYESQLTLTGAALGIRHYSLARATRQGPAAGRPSTSDAEKGAAPVADAEMAAPIAPGAAQPLDVEKTVGAEGAGDDATVGGRSASGERSGEPVAGKPNDERV
jgi:hypothetical protein